MAVSDSNTREHEALHAVEASGWVETMRHASPGDEMRFVAWLKESPRNVRDFLLMLSLDCALETLDAGRLESIESLIAQVDERVTALPTRPAPTGRTRRQRRWKFAAAASALLAVGGGAAWLMDRRAGWQEIETSTGEQRTLELADGSVVYLNTHSRLRVRLSAHVRDVRLLRGEALFRVHHDAARPFLVYTDDAMVQAVGTQFDVYRRDDGTVVAVLEGRVNLTPAAGGGDASGGAAAPAGPGSAVGPGASRSLSASEEARVSHAGSVSIREVNNVSDTVAWRERRLIFHEQTLGQIVHEFNRYRTNPIRLEGGAVTERIYTGVFDADDAESLVQVLARDPALSVERSGEAVVVKLR